MRKLRQRIMLIHKLRELRRAKKLLDRRDDRTNIDERLRRDDVDILDCHAFLDHALHARKADAELVLQKFADGAHAAVAQMIDVVRRANAVHEVQQIVDGRHDVVARDRAMIVGKCARAQNLHALAVSCLRARKKDGGLVLAKKSILLLRCDVFKHRLVDDDVSRHDDLARLLVHDGLREHPAENAALPAQLLRQLVAADHSEIVALGIEEKAVEELLRIVDRRRLAGAQTLVDLDESLLLGACAVAFQRCLDALIVVEQLGDRAVGAVAKRTHKDGYGQFPRAVDAYGNDVVRIRFQLNPCAAVWNDRRVVELLARGVDRLTVVSARRTHELADDDTLCAVNDEGSCIGHEREITHEHFLLLDFARLAIDQAHVDAQRRCERNVPLLALIKFVLRLAEREVFKGQHKISSKILNR